MTDSLLHPALTAALLVLSSVSLLAGQVEEAPVTAESSERRWEALAGPFYLRAGDGEERATAIFPFYSSARDPRIEHTERDFLYPLASMDRFGGEWRLHILQLLSFSGGSQTHDWERVTLFPLYFRQRSSDPEQDYRAFLPFYGTLRNRLMRDEIRVMAFPLFVRTRKRDVVTDNWLFPFFHIRRGEELSGWQLWPLAGRERKGVTTRTDVIGETRISGGHDRLTLAWPLFFRDRTGIGTGNPRLEQALLPLFSRDSSPERSSFTAPWPLGITVTRDRKKGYRELGLPWPLVLFGRGPDRRTDRIWPLWGRSENPATTRSFLLWPLYRSRELETDYEIERERRIAFFLFREIESERKEDGSTVRRRYLWPLFSSRRNEETGERHFRTLSLLEPFLPTNETVERHYTAPTSIWTRRHLPATGESDTSILWNLYRRTVRKEEIAGSVLFGLIRWQRNPSGGSVRILGARVSGRNATPSEHVPADR